MTAVLAALVPIALVIATGFALSRLSLISDEQWQAIEHVSYYVLFPAIIAYSLITSDFGPTPVFTMALAVFAGLATLHLAMWTGRPVLQRVMGIDAPSFTSVFQGAGRWHTFLGLAIMPALFGPQGLALGAIAMLGIVPLSNASSIAMLARHGDSEGRARPGFIRSLVTNPFLLAIAIGGIIRLIGVPVPAVISDALELVGRGALGLALLCVGAGLRLDQAASQKAAIGFALAAKMCVLPALIYGWTTLLGVGGIPQIVAVLAGAMPTSSAAFILARQLGGNAPLVANIMTLQVLVAAITLPVIVWLMQ